MTSKNSYIKSRKHRGSNYVPAITFVAMAATAGVNAQAQEATLSTVTVQESAAPDYQVDQPSSPKFTQKLVNTTQTISVIPEAVIREQGATTLTEALRNIPGVGSFSLGENGRQNTGDSVSMRGFDVSNSIFVDGVRDLGNITHDVFNTEQVEVFKGPAGTDNGRTAASGSINLVSKKARLGDAFGGTVGLGTGKYKRTTLDLNKQLSEGAALRLNLVGEDSGVAGRDVLENKKWGVAASLGLGLNTDSRIHLDYLHLEQNNLPDGGVPVIGLKGYNAAATLSPAVRDYLNTHRVNASNYYGSVDDYDDATVDMLTARLEHRISANTTLSNIARWGSKSQNMMATRPNAITATNADPAQWTIARSGNSVDQKDKLLTNQTNLSTKFMTGALEHSVSTGVELAREESQSYTLEGGVYSAASTNLWNPDASAGRTPLTRTGAYQKKKIDTYSVYAFDTLKFNEQWQVNGGLRLDHVNIRASALTGTPLAFSELKSSDNLWNWKLGALYKPADNGSIYANYAVQQQPPGTITGGDGAGGGIVFPTDGTSLNSNNDFSRAPQKIKTLELGTKWELMDQRLLLSSALFKTDLSNEISCEYVGNTASNCVQNGKKTVKGLELSAVGQITRDWQITTGLTLQRTKTDAASQRGTGTISADGSNDLPYTPKTAFTLWSSYKVNSQWTLGGGGRYMGSMKKARDGNQTGPAAIPDYWVFDAMASYQVNKNVSVKFNVYNLFDEDYVASINRGGNRYFPGAERSYRVTANFDF